MSFSLPTFLFQLVNFLVLLYILRRFVYAPLYRMIDERRAAIARATEQAQEAEREAQAVRAEVLKERDAIERERARMIEEARAAMVEERQRAEAASAEEGAREQARLERELAEMRQR